MRILCINIDGGAEWELAQAEFKRVGLTVERFPAIVEDNRVLGFNKSVYECMKLAEGGDLLLFEDDVIFDELNKEISHVNGRYAHHMISYILSLLPEDSLTVHLGCNIYGADTTVWQMPTAYGPHLAKLHNCWQSHATLYSPECVKFILENFNPNICDGDHPIFDEWLRVNVLSQGRSFLTKPMIAYQRPRKSEIWGIHTDYRGAHTAGNEWLKKNL